MPPKCIFPTFCRASQDCNGMCDNCSFAIHTDQLDVSAHAKLIASLLQDLQETDQRITILQLVNKLMTKQKELDSELKREELEHLVVQLIVDRVLKEEFQHTAYATNAYATVGPLSKHVLQGKKNIKMEISCGQTGSSSSTKQPKHTKLCGLELKLDELRKDLASCDGGIYPHSILSTQQITTLSVRPKSLEQLEKVIGKLKTEKYGTRILKEIGTYEPNCQTDTISDETQDERASKRLKSRQNFVVLESSDDEA